MVTQKGGSPHIGCPVCRTAVRVSTSTSKTGKVAVVLVCPNDGRHFRAFINDKIYVRRVLDALESRAERAAP